MRAFRAILWKEWVSLRPFAWLLLALFVFGLLLMQSTEYFDDYPIWDKVLSSTESMVTIVMATFILCVVVSAGLLVREKDEGTLLYLDGLPLSRVSVYAAKWLVAAGLITALNVLWTLEVVAYDWLSRNSASPPTPWRSILVFAALEVFLGLYFLTVLVALSFLRVWSLVALGGIFWIVFWLASLQVPYVELLNPFHLIAAPAEVGDRWEWPRLQLMVMGGIGVAAWLGGLALFSLRTGSAGALVRRMGETWWGRLLGAAGAFLALGIWIGILFAVSTDEDDDASREDARGGRGLPEAPSGGDRIATAESERFSFIYRQRMERRMRVLVREADPVYETVADFLEVPEEERNARIVVDLSSPLASHNAGQAYWKKIRMSLPAPARGGKGAKGAKGAARAEDEALAILGHEVCHVLVEILANGRLEESFDSARWFHEGLASYVEHRFFRDEDAETGFRRWAALAAIWDEVHFVEMVDDSLLSSRRDPFLVYPAGYLWVDSLVRVYGDGAPAALLRALGRDGGPRKLGGLALWRDACLAAGFDLERVRADFRRQLAELKERHAGELAAFPEIASGSAERLGSKVVVRPDLPEGWDRDLPEGAKLVCRVRPRSDAGPEQWRYAEITGEGTFEVPALSFLRPGLGFQVGWRIGPSGSPTVFGQWVNVVLGEGDESGAQGPERADEGSLCRSHPIFVLRRRGWIGRIHFPSGLVMW